MEGKKSHFIERARAYLDITVTLQLLMEVHSYDGPRCSCTEKILTLISQFN